jgi:hypothetical protein
MDNFSKKLLLILFKHHKKCFSNNITEKDQWVTLKEDFLREVEETIESKYPITAEILLETSLPNDDDIVIIR